MRTALTSALATIAVLACGATCVAQTTGADTRTQFPPGLANSFIGVDFGTVDDPLSTQQLSSGATAASVRTPRGAFQVALFGHEFSKYLSGEIAYARPLRWASYTNANGTGLSPTVWVVQGEFSLTASLPLTGRLSVCGRGGLAITSRHGAQIGDTEIVASAHFPSALVGGCARMAINDRWQIVAGVTRIAGSREHVQPRTVLVTGGLRYYLRPRTAAELRRAAAGQRFFPAHTVSVGVVTGAGYGVPHFFSSTVPIFWNGNVSIARGVTLRYEQNVFHTASRFGFDLGASVGRWTSRRNGDAVTTLSVFPVLRFMLLRTGLADVGVSYSLAGATFISKRVLDDSPIGTTRFTFQDFMSVNAFVGQGRHVTVGIGLVHFSNGNLFPLNAAVATPLTVTAGYVF